MRRLLLILISTVLAGLAGASTLSAPQWNRVSPNLRQTQFLARAITDFYGASSTDAEPLFVGSEMCLGCHSGPNAIHGYDTSKWRNTLHSKPFKAVPDDRFAMIVGKGIIADADGNGVDDFKDGLDFNAANQSAFEAYKPNAPILGYSKSGGYTMTIGAVSYRIFFAWGGNGMPAKQRFVVRIPVVDRPGGISGGAYVSPLQFNETTGEWVPYHPESWYEADGTPIFGPSATAGLAATQGRSFDRLCSGCHFTGATIQQDSYGEWVATATPTILVRPDNPNMFDYNGDGIIEETDIGCESCHGPGSAHIMQGGNPEKIFNPKTMSALESNSMCGACHARGMSSAGTLGFAWDEAADHRYVPGDDLEKYLVENPGLWPDGKTSKDNYQQFQDFYQSTKPTFPTHMVTCYECHNAHLDTKHQILDKIEDDGLVIPTENDNNSLCLACHATHGPFEEITKEMVAELEDHLEEIGQVVSAHSNHPYAPERTMGLGRCSKCHMPRTATSAIDYDIHSHTFEAIPPEKTLLYQGEGGMPSSCSVSCHRNIADIFPNSLDFNIGNWTEEADVTLARWLMEYYGPEGKWWKTHSVPED